MDIEHPNPADEETNAAIAELQQLAGAGGDGETATDHATFMAALDRNIAAREEQREREQLVNGMYALGDRVDTCEEASDAWSQYREPFRWSEPSSVGEVVLVRRAPPEPATYDVRYGDGRVAEAVPPERIRRPRTKVIAPDGDSYLSPLESPRDLIIQATCVGDVATVEKCLDAGVSIEHALNGSYDSLIYTASGRGHTDLVRLLIKRGALFDEPHYDTDGAPNLTPLQYALFHGYHATAQVLIEHGANPYAMCRIYTHSPDDHQLSIDDNGILRLMSPLFLACRAAADEPMKDYGIDEDFTDWEEDRDQTGADGAACVRLLLEHVYLEAKVGRHRWTQLHIACLAGRVGVAKVLLAHGADPFCADTTGMTPLDAARGLSTDRSAWLNWYETHKKYKKGTDGVPLAGQARREKAALNEMFDRYLAARWKQTVDLTFARLPDHAIASDEYLSCYLGSFLFGDFLPRKKQGDPAAAPASQDDADDASSVASSDVSSTMWDGS